jgi:hypothetical protein
MNAVASADPIQQPGQAMGDVVEHADEIGQQLRELTDGDVTAGEPVDAPGQR